VNLRWALAIPIAALLFPRLARADAAAEALFEEGRKLSQAGRFAEACPKFEESFRLQPGMGTEFNLADCLEHIGKTASAQPGMGTEFNLADCLEHIGKTASAWGRYRSVAAAAKLAGQSAREKVAQERANRLEPNLCRLRIDVEKENGVVVERDGSPVGEGQWRTPVPIDPGEHTITANAPGKIPFNRAIAVSSCNAPIVVTIPTLAVDPLPPASPSTGAGEGPAPAARTTTNGTRTALIVTGLALTAVGVGITAGFGAASLSSKNEAAPHCKADGSCDGEGLALKADALRYGDMATVGLVTASVFAVATVVVVIAMPSTQTTTALNLARGTITF